MVFSTKRLLVLVVCPILIISIYFFGFKDDGSKSSNSIVIILSPHFDDAVLSLGGMMAKEKSELVVATFFTQQPIEVAHTYWDKISGFSDSNEAHISRVKENENALALFNTTIKNYDYLDFQYRKGNEEKKIRESIVKDIESIVDTYKDQDILLYGPGIFGEKITHPDHKIVHDAFIDFFRSNKNIKISFFVYEDFPYIQEFINTNPFDDFNEFLSKQENFIFKEHVIKLTEPFLIKKIASIYTYTSQVKAFSMLGDDLDQIVRQFNQSRCKLVDLGIFACEVVHKVEK